MSVTRIAAIQPLTFRGDDEERNVGVALAAIAQAAAAGAQLVTFPEGYPGPYSGRLGYDPDDAIGAEARAHGVHVVHSRLEPADDGRRYFLILRLVGPDGQTIGTYTRVQVPPTHVNEVLFGKDLVAGDEAELAVYETAIGRIGLLLCSEVYCPELARVLTLRGADILVYPVGGMIYELAATWKTMIWARAIENLVYVAATQNIYGCEDGIGMVAGPELVLAESTVPGMLLADLDLDRLEELRALDQRLDLPMPYRVIPGLVRWRRPELYGELVEQSASEASGAGERHEPAVTGLPTGGSR
jgi:predicted amidohydrolase